MPSGWGTARPVTSYKALWMPDRPVHQSGYEFGHGAAGSIGGGAHLERRPGRNNFSTHVRWEIIQTEAILPDTGRPFPTELWNVGLGTSYQHLFDNGWTGGRSISLGSASDQPFYSLREATVMASGFLRVPQGERQRLDLFA